MPGKLRQGTSGNGKVVIREENYGSDTSVICFPGLSSCISITVISSDGRLLGGHITVVTEDNIVSEMLSKLDAGIGSAYVVGQIEEFKLKTKLKNFNTRKKISSKIRRAIGGIHKVYFCDIGPKSHDADVMVSKNGTTADFGWAPIRKVYWEGGIDMDGFTPLDVNSFVSR